MRRLLPLVLLASCFAFIGGGDYTQINTSSTITATSVISATDSTIGRDSIKVAHCKDYSAVKLQIVVSDAAIAVDSLTTGVGKEDSVVITLMRKFSDDFDLRMDSVITVAPGTLNVTWPALTGDSMCLGELWVDVYINDTTSDEVFTFVWTVDIEGYLK